MISIILGIFLSSLIWALIILLAKYLSLGKLAVYISHISIFGWALFIALIIIISKYIIKKSSKVKTNNE